ncbi:MAG TPA: glycosyltransferase family 4 protein, partial [Candidatus Polarisedimenticolia bacterium]|nr:glycosyltransferase family 4 protein [Candidatus Polarisedimenticolia bacterium]
MRPTASRLRILLVNDYASPTGGAEILIRNLRDGLIERGHEVRLLASRALPAGASATVDFSCDGSLRRRRVPLQVFNPSARRAIRDAIRELRPDVVHVSLFLTQLSPAILAPLRELPALLHVQWYRIMCPLGTKLLPDGSACQDPWGAACLRHRCLGAHEWAPLMLQRSLWERSRDVFDLYVAPSNRVKTRIQQAGLAPVEVVPGAVPVSAGPGA